ncbi:bifunctional folylpolyglutamate synthase/dihydrofolate synthase [bacterium]|nr:bifunctional folylpolyglutamate synthase/dihydrofolate synthase [bacterium]
MSKLTYEAAVNYLESFIDYEKKTNYSYNPRLWNLERMQLLLNSLGEPQKKLKVIHIAGSKGKGSTAAMIHAILNTAGYKTGLYTSPHLITPLERFRIKSKLMSENQFCELVEQLQPHIDEVNQKTDIGKLSFFEIYTAMGFVFFAVEEVDFLVLEVGLGGRLDATNVVEPLVSVITQISLEHTNLLGDNLASIATEKAGIIKPNSLVMSSPQQPEVMEVIEKSCAEKKAQLFQVGKEISFERLSIDQSGQYFTLKSNIAEYPRYHLPLLGKHQLINAATAVGAIELLRFHGYTISGEQIKIGLEQTNWPARMQVIGHEPTILLDVAHSPQSARVLRESIIETFIYDKLILVVGISGDKDIKGIGAELCPIADIAILTKASSNPRAADPASIKWEWEEFDVLLVIKNTVASALDYARNIAGKNDLICITGSFYPLGEAMTLLGVSTK